ncbi:S41 family peptidase [Pontibacter toksunensis]|uniref:S41 family peptidase n=1 Tax=Pontibacter toksunensis TaxID=1332631 RepID=A0ABW6BYD7_9BACT
MRKRSVIILSITFMLCGCSNQQPLSETQKLESLARVWGFLKYYHPSVGSGKTDWDSDFIQILPKVKAAQSKEELSAVYLEWIEGLEKVKKVVPETKGKEPAIGWADGLGIWGENGPVTKEKTFDKNFNLDWTDDKSLFSEKLISKLDYIEKNRFRGKIRYGTFNPAVFSNSTKEATGAIQNMKSPNEASRLLTLFTYWNLIEYFFPYKYQTDQDWNEVLTEMIPRFKDAESVSEYHLTVVEMVAKVNDSHASISPEYAPEVFGSYWIPARFKLIDGKAVIKGFLNDSMAIADDIKVGDIVYKVNGEDISDIVRRESKYISASNEDGKRRNFFNAVFNGMTDNVTVTLERDGLVQEKQLKRYLFEDFGYKPGAKGVKWEVLNGNIGYVNMGLLKPADVAEMMESLMKCRAIIFDIRNYPQLTMREVTKYLNPGPRPFAKIMKPDSTYPGKYFWSDIQLAGEQNASPYRGKVVILVNEHTQSQAEYTVMALQTADSATVIGSQTAGADGNVVYFELPGGIRTRISGLGVFYPDGRETQRIGIVPDIEVKPTIEGIRNRRDEVLEKALEFVER